MCEVRASVDVQLLVGVGQVRLDGLWGDEQRLSDLWGALSSGRHVGDAGFGGGKRVTSGEGWSARSSAGG